MDKLLLTKCLRCRGTVFANDVNGVKGVKNRMTIE
jgi:hypothetical protein